jgi:O-antigen/teichoic acid export membrane protein
MLRKLSSGVASQIVNSVTNLTVGLLLIRHTSDQQYGYYILLSTAVVFFTTLQTAFVQTPTVIRLTQAADSARADLIGSLRTDQSRLTPLIALVTTLGVATAVSMGQLQLDRALLLLAGAAALITGLRREFYRVMLFAMRLSGPVLLADTTAAILLIAGTAIATLTPDPTLAVAIAMSAAALLSSILLANALWRRRPWNRSAPPGATRELFKQGAWSTLGAGARFLFSQGYSYLVAYNLSVADIAALAATRLPLSPITMLSNGIAPTLLPTVAEWNNRLPPAIVLRRVAGIALGMLALSSAYLAALWLARDLVFVDLLHKDFAQRDSLLLLWSVSTVVSTCRDPFMYFLTLRGHFRQTTTLTVLSAVVSLSVSLIAMREIGPIGAPVGVLTGELLNLIATAVSSVLAARGILKQ